jgi:serine/threonine protein kinase
MDCVRQQQAIYDRVCTYLQSTEGSRAQLFPPVIALEELARRFALRPISSEQGLETYERIAVEDHVRDIISELCKIPAAREEFMLGDGIWFDNHTNALTESQVELDTNHPPNLRRPRPDQFCIHRVDGSTNSLLLTVEYKPPHKLSVETLRAGLRPMELWEEMVKCNTVPTDPVEKLRYNAERLVDSAMVQANDVMIEEGRADAILTNGLARVLLHVPYDDPATLLYHFCEPHTEIDGEDLQNLRQPKTSIARVLCHCLRSFRSPTRDQEWRNSARSQLHVWETSFDHARSLIPEEELRKTPPHSENTSSPELTSSDYQPSSSPLESPTENGRRVPTRSQARCTPLSPQHRSQSPDSSGSDSNQATGRKRGFSHVTSSPSAQRAARQRETGNNQDHQSRHRDAQFCTQRCLLGLQSGGALDDRCPNVMLHRRNKGDLQHRITSEDLVRLLKAQLDENIDRCTPLGGCGAYGAPFKLTCIPYGYTVVGKGTTSGLWKEVSREAEVYRILQKAQGSAVPVFLGTIDLAKIYFLHGAGEIRHMLVMAWGGESMASMELTPKLLQRIHQSNKEIRALGIIHEDLRRDNVLWNEELGRAMIIDFHRSTLKCRPTLQQPRASKRRLRQPEIVDSKRLRVT